MSVQLLRGAGRDSATNTSLPGSSQRRTTINHYTGVLEVHKILSSVKLTIRSGDSPYQMYSQLSRDERSSGFSCKNVEYMHVNICIFISHTHAYVHACTCRQTIQLLTGPALV